MRYPDGTAAVCTKVLCLSVKAGHWETEKARHKDAERDAPYGISQKTCFDVIL